MKFRSEAQRRAVMASITGGSTPRAQTFWAGLNPYRHIEGVLHGRRTKRGSAGLRQVLTPPASAEHQRQASAILRRHSAIAGIGSTTQRHAALRQTARIGLIAGAVALPAGYLGLRTRLGQRVANRLILRARPVKALRSLIGFSQGRAISRAGEVVGAAERASRRKAFGLIDRATAKLTGVHDLPTELLYQEGRLKTRLLGSPRHLRARYGKELQAIERNMAEVPMGTGLIDRADAVFKRGLGRAARRLGLPMTGPISRGSRQIMEVGHDPALLVRRKQVEKLYRKVRRRGKASLGTFSLTRLKSGTIRRRGHLLESAFFPSRIKALRPTISHIPTVHTPKKLKDIAARNVRQLASFNIDTMSIAELRHLYQSQPGLSAHTKAAIRKRLQGGSK